MSITEGFSVFWYVFLLSLRQVAHLHRISNVFSFSQCNFHQSEFLWVQWWTNSYHFSLLSIKSGQCISWLLSIRSLCIFRYWILLFDSVVNARDFTCFFSSFQKYILSLFMQESIHHSSHILWREWSFDEIIRYIIIIIKTLVVARRFCIEPSDC